MTKAEEILEKHINKDQDIRLYLKGSKLTYDSCLDAINEALNMRIVGCSWPTKEEITSELKAKDKEWSLSENLNEKQAFNLGFRTCYRWLKNRMT